MKKEEKQAKFELEKYYQVPPLFCPVYNYIYSNHFYNALWVKRTNISTYYSLQILGKLSKSPVRIELSHQSNNIKVKENTLPGAINQ